MKRPPIWMTITMVSGFLLMSAGAIYYAFIGPHPDASGSIDENVLNPLFWSDHPGLSAIALGAVLVAVTYISLTRFDKNSS